MKNYVKKYLGYDVPKGATMAGFGRFRYNDGFYKEKNDSLFFYKAGGNEWKETALEEKDIDAIELPLADEFVPEVGQEVDLISKAEDIDSIWGVKYIASTNDNVFVSCNSGRELLYRLEIFDICPIKSERDKQAEVFAKILQANDQRVTGLCNKDLGMFMSQAYDLYDNGVRYM